MTGPAWAEEIRPRVRMVAVGNFILMSLRVGDAGVLRSDIRVLVADE